jgi:hypothetical protein
VSKLTDFLNKHDACDEGRDWALATGCETVAELWLRDDLRTEWRIWLACRTLPDNILRKFACRCVREIWHLLTDERSRNAIEVAERHADGLASDEELAAARDAARDAAWAAARAAASAAAWSAAWAEVSDAASAAVWSAARAAARAAVSDAAWAAAMAAAMDAASVRQNEILRELAPTLKEVQP